MKKISTSVCLNFTLSLSTNYDLENIVRRGIPHGSNPVAHLCFCNINYRVFPFPFAIWGTITRYPRGSGTTPHALTWQIRVLTRQITPTVYAPRFVDAVFDFRTLPIWCDISVTREPNCLRNSLLHGTLSGKVSLGHKHDILPSKNLCDFLWKSGVDFSFSGHKFTLRCPRCILKVPGEYRSGLR